MSRPAEEMLYLAMEDFRVDVVVGKGPGATAIPIEMCIRDSEKVFGDPHQAAKRWAEQGASWLHLVDLDAAFGRGSNAELLAEVIAGVDLNVELSGGIRDDASLELSLIHI